jgi:HprK-related kinase A
MRLNELSSDDLSQRLRSGLQLVTGPFTFRIVSSLPDIAQGLAKLYGEFQLSDEPFADFHVRIDSLGGPRRFYHPQAQFWSDEYSPFKPLPRDQAFAMLEWGMNWCIASHAHYYLMLHAAVLERDGHALVMPGDPGAGKSTLTAALMLDGWRLLSDEIALIDRDNGLLYGLARPVSLKNASIDIIRGHDHRSILGSTAHDTHKGSVAHLKPTADSVLKASEPVQPAWIIFPRWKAGVEARLTAHSKSAAFLHLASHAFNYSLLGQIGFQRVAALMDRSNCWDFEYGRLEEATALLRELMP